MASFGRENGKIHGLKEARANFARLPDVARTRYATATRESAQMIVARARLRVPVRFGFLKNAIDFAFDKKSGVALVGSRKEKHLIPVAGGKTKTAQPSKYLHLVEFGTSHSKATPVIGPAGEAEKPNFERQMRTTATDVERDLSASRFL